MQHPHPHQLANMQPAVGLQMAPAPITSTPEVEELKRFLATAPQLWTKPDDPPIRSYPLSNGEHISCVFWRGKFFITGTDIVKVLLFRFSQVGRPVLNVKKFEEGVFSDLRNLKPGTEALLEEPRSEFLDFLFRHGCIRTQKKQKVFFWNCVPHESLFLDAIERDFKREGSLYHMNMMMNHTRYLQKQVAMMQQASQFSGTASPNLASHPSSAHYLMGPQLMPNGRVPMPTAFAPVPANGFMGNAQDPFLIQQRPSLGSNKVPLPQADPISVPADDPFFNYLSGEGVVDPNASVDPSFLMNLHEY